MYSNLFNNQGELNAGSTREALQNVIKLAHILQDGVSSNLSLAGMPSISNEERNSLVDRALYTQEGKVALAQAMPNP